MSTIISSFESAFYYLVSFSSFDHFMILILFGIIFQLKDWKHYFSLFLALCVGSLAGLILCSVDIINFSASTIRLLMAFSFLAVGIHHLISGNTSPNAIRYNFFALVGIVLGVGISGHYARMFGNGFSFQSTTGYALGLLAGYLIISLLSLLLSSVSLAVFRTDRKSFNLAISGIGVGISLVLIYLRY